MNILFCCLILDQMLEWIFFYLNIYLIMEVLDVGFIFVEQCMVKIFGMYVCLYVVQVINVLINGDGYCVFIGNDIVLSKYVMFWLVIVFIL